MAPGFKLLDGRLRVWFERDAVILRAHYSTLIEGYHTDPNRIQQVARTRKPRTPSEAASLDYVDTLSHVDNLDPDLIHGHSTILNLHARIMRHAAPDTTPGQYRTGGVSVGTVYVPPSPPRMSRLQDRFVSWMNDLQRKREDPAILAGLAHLGIAQIHPFFDGNGRTARALATLMLNRGDHRFERLVVLDGVFARDQAAYYAQLRRANGSLDKPNSDVTEWLVYSLLALEAAVTDLLTRLQEGHELLRQLDAEDDLNPRQISALAGVWLRGAVYPRTFQEVSGVSRGTVWSDLSGLVEAGWLTVSGQTTARAYRPGERLIKLA
ncbi:MAG: Fic family protein, partial [Anaerolineae bacterium]